MNSEKPNSETEFPTTAVYMYFLERIRPLEHARNFILNTLNSASVKGEKDELFGYDVSKISPNDAVELLGYLNEYGFLDREEIFESIAFKILMYQDHQKCAEAGHEKRPITNFDWTIKLG